MSNDYASDDPAVQEVLAGEAAVEAFIQEAAPEAPQIRAPGSGNVKLMYGVEIEGERRVHAEVRELNGRDEEALSRLDGTKPDYPVLVVDTVVRRAVKTIDGFRPSPDALHNLLMADRDLLFKEILLTTYGTTKEYENLQCPSCEGELDILIDVEGILNVKGLPDEDTPGTEVTLRDGRVVSVHYPTGGDQLKIYSTDKIQTDAEVNTQILTRCIDTVDGTPPANAREFALELSVKDRGLLVDALADGPGVRFKEVEVPCEHCGKPLPFLLGWADLLQL